jgi:hypothetical protein
MSLNALPRQGVLRDFASMRSEPAQFRSYDRLLGRVPEGTLLGWV